MTTTEQWLRRDLEMAQAACAEMRQLLIQWHSICNPFREEVSQRQARHIEHALSTDCGSALLDELKRLREACDKSKQALTGILDHEHLLVCSCPCEREASDALVAIDKARGKP